MKDTVLMPMWMSDLDLYLWVIGILMDSEDEPKTRIVESMTFVSPNLASVTAGVSAIFGERDPEIVSTFRGQRVDYVAIID